MNGREGVGFSPGWFLVKETVPDFKEPERFKSYLDPMRDVPTGV